MVTSDALAHKELLRKVAEVNGTVVSQEEVCELERVLHFNCIIGKDVLFESHLHQQGLIRSEDLEDGRIVTQESMKDLNGVSCVYSVLFQADD